MRQSPIPPSAVAQRAAALVLAAVLAGGSVPALAAQDDAASIAPPGAPKPGALAVVEAQLQAFNRHDIAALAAGVAPDFVWLSVSGDSVGVEVRGRAEFERGMAAYFAEFPDVRSTMENAVVNGRFVAFRERVRWTGKNGERSQSSLAVYEVENGLIRRVWYYPLASDR